MGSTGRMRTIFDKNNTLLARARTLANFCHSKKLNGWEILRGIKMSKITSLFGKNGINWNWSILEKVFGKLDKSKCDCLSPAIFLFNIQYRGVGEDRSVEAFHNCNLNFLLNAIMCIKLRYSWINIRRYLMMRLVKRIFKVIEQAGLEYWEKSK